MEGTPPPSVQMVQLLAGFQVSQALYAAARTGFTDALADGPRPVDEVADSLQLHAPSLARLARTLTGLGVLTDSGSGSYALTPLGRTLTSDDPGSMRDLALMWMETHYEPFAGLADTVRTGTPAAAEFYGVPFFDWLGGHPEQVQRFTGAMANLTDGIKAGAIAGHDWSSVRRILDVGGADGALLAQVLSTNPAATGTVLDLPQVVPAVAIAAKAAGLEDRLDSVAGDFFDAVPGGYDTYVMSMILHDWDDDSARRILANIGSTAEPGTRVVALELVVPPGDAPHMSKMIDLTMLGMLTGKERTEGEFRELVQSAGLAFRGVTGTPTPLSFIEAEVVATA
jgi:hypothetical protein